MVNREDPRVPRQRKKVRMLAPSLQPGRRDHGQRLMEFFLSRQDKALLLIMDSASRSGHVFKVVADETWTLIWSGIVTQDFLESPDGSGSRRSWSRPLSQAGGRRARI